MISEENVRHVLHATLLFNELHKKTLMAAIPSYVKTKTQMDILVVLYATGPLKMSALSARCSIALEQASRAVRSLRETGLVACDRNPENRREVIAQLTETGSTLLEDHMENLHRLLEGCLKNLSQEELDRLVSLSAQATKLLMKTDFESVILDPNASA